MDTTERVETATPAAITTIWLAAMAGLIIAAGLEIATSSRVPHWSPADKLVTLVTPVVVTTFPGIMLARWSALPASARAAMAMLCVGAFINAAVLLAKVLVTPVVTNTAIVAELARSAAQLALVTGGLLSTALGPAILCSRGPSGTPR